MAIALGMENKKQVRLVVALFAAIAAIAGWEVYGMLAPPRLPSLGKLPGATHAAAQTRHSSRSRLEPVLRMEELAQSEQVDYGEAGRNVFAPVAPPAAIEAPLASARPADTAPAGPPVPEAPQIPAMDLKYLGFAQSKDKTYSAMFLHNGDFFMARSGDIMFHRFRVGVIQPGSVQVTDLSYNNTQTIAVSAN